jgi:arsenate reductase
VVICRQAGPTIGRRLFAEYLGALLLCAVVVGSGIAAQQLSPADIGLQLLENAAATAAGLYVIILVLGQVSGAHLNPAVSLAEVMSRRLPLPVGSAYVVVQIAGCISGAVLANLMFGRSAIDISHTDRASVPHALAEVVATAGLILVIFALVNTGRMEKIPAAVGAYIGAAYFFTSSASFANPAITVGRIFSDTFAGISPGSAPLYIAAQIVGGLLGLLTVRLLYPTTAVLRQSEPPVHESDSTIRDADRGTPWTHSTSNTGRSSPSQCR